MHVAPLDTRTKLSRILFGELIVGQTNGSKPNNQACAIVHRDPITKDFFIRDGKIKTDEEITEEENVANRRNRHKT